MHVGWVIVPTAGASGVIGCVLINTLDDATEVHSIELVTLNVYVPASSPEIVLLVPVPVIVVPSGNLDNVHVPVDGKLLKTTLPVATVHVGWVIIPTIGGV